jgi:hypothetical protein
MHVNKAMKGPIATFEKHPYAFTSYVPINWNPGPSCSEMK